MKSVKGVLFLQQFAVFVPNLPISSPPDVGDGKGKPTVEQAEAYGAEIGSMLCIQEPYPYKSSGWLPSFEAFAIYQRWAL